MVVVVAMLTQAAGATIYFHEDWDGSNGAWTPTFDFLSTDLGDRVPGKNGWVQLNGVVPGTSPAKLATHRATQGNHSMDNPNPDDLRWGIGGSICAGNNWEGVDDNKVIGSAHEFNYEGDKYVVLSAITRVCGDRSTRDPTDAIPHDGGQINGVATLYLGDSTLTTTAGTNAYVLRLISQGCKIDKGMPSYHWQQAGAGYLQVLEGGVTTQLTNVADTGFGFSDTGMGQFGWFEAQIVVKNAGRANESAWARYRDVDDNTGAAVDPWTYLGSYNQPGNMFDLTHLGIESQTQQGGPEVAPFDDVTILPEPATLALLSIGGVVTLLKRRR
jgi:hypothetical protein